MVWNNLVSSVSCTCHASSKSERVDILQEWCYMLSDLLLRIHDSFHCHSPCHIYCYWQWPNFRCSFVMIGWKSMLSCLLGALLILMVQIICFTYQLQQTILLSISFSIYFFQCNMLWCMAWLESRWVYSKEYLFDSCKENERRNYPFQNGTCDSICKFL